jgi:hypothetical protein
MKPRKAARQIDEVVADVLSDDASSRYTPEQIAAAARYEKAQRRFAEAVEALRRAR